MAVALAVSPLAGAQLPDRNPDSKVVVVDVKGEALISKDGRVSEMTRRTTYVPQGATIETGEDSTNAMVWSNGTGMFLDSQSRLEINRFNQEPFSPDRADMDTEPSRSTTDAFLARGLVGLCTSKLVAGTAMGYRTPHAQLAVRGRRVVMEVDGRGTKVSVLEGSVTAKSLGIEDGGLLLESGQQAFIPANGTPWVTVIPDQELPLLRDKVSVACAARKQVYFDWRTSDMAAGAEGDEIVALEVTPPSISPSVTVSPAMISR